MLDKLEKTKDSEAIGYFTSEHLRMSGAYWCIGSNMLLGRNLEARRSEMINFVKKCQHKCGGFGGNIGHDPHVTTSLYALLIMAMFDAVSEIDTEQLALYFKGLQNPDGSFKGDHSGEVDTRFSYCAVSALSLLQRLDIIDRVKARNFIL
jgi:geranylgeranyl transferase type-2 subunit beta